MGGKRAYLNAPSLPAKTGCSGIFSYFIFTFMCPDRAARPRRGVRANGAARPCVHLWFVEMIWMSVGQGPIFGCNSHRGRITAGNICLQLQDFFTFPQTLSGRWEDSDQEPKVWINKQWLCDCDTFQNNASEMLDGTRCSVGIYQCMFYSIIK